MTTPPSTKDSTETTNKNDDVYESISDEELDLFDENEEEQLPQPASVMEVDWSLLSSMNKTAPVIGIVLRSFKSFDHQTEFQRWCSTNAFNL